MFFTPLSHSVTIQKAVSGRDSSGGNTETFSTRTANVPCLITQQGGSAAGLFAQDGRSTTHTVSFLTSASDCQPGDRLLVVTGPSAGKYLRVTGISVHGGVGWINQFTRLNCTELRA